MSKTKMSPAEITAFLTDQGFGILSLAADDDPYSVAVSFGYDEENERCVFNFVMTETSRKREHLEPEDGAILAVYEYNTPDDWATVFVEGVLQPLPEQGNQSALEAFAETAVPIPFDVLDELAVDVPQQWYELQVSERSGLQASG